MEYNLKEIKGSNGKPRKVRSLKTFTSVPRLFLILPLFNIINGSENRDEPITVPKHQNTRNIEIKNAQLTIDNDFDVFLFILRKVFRSNSTSIEFSTSEMMDELNIEKVSRAQYLKTFIKSVKRLSNIHVEYEERINGEWQHTFFNFIEGRLTKSKGTIEVSKFFIEFFGNLKELYEINPEILSLLNKYQRILYVLYVCNRMSTTNYFSVDRLKERFNINSDKMPEKQFIKKIRDTNKELQELGLILGFKEIKALDKDGKKDNPRQPTVQFDVDYTYKSLYPKISKLRELAALIKRFKVTKDVIFEDIKEEPKSSTNYEDLEWV
ncbi:replication initiation protein [Pseudomonas simiae]|uniref:replication initiation protein n=1 Tax=Pseudomonas simiae TaxID=321846 RepID=UPI0033164AF3